MLRAIGPRRPVHRTRDHRATVKRIAFPGLSGLPRRLSVRTATVSVSPCRPSEFKRYSTSSQACRDGWTVDPMIMDVIKQGARARTIGRPRDACPYPGDSRERRAWYEGYDGSIWIPGTREPHPAVAIRGTPVRETAPSLTITVVPA